jgi:hypothetical protein
VQPSSRKVRSYNSNDWGIMFAKSKVERDAALEELKVYGRDPNYADPIFTKEVRRSFGGVIRYD